MPFAYQPPRAITNEIPAMSLDHVDDDNGDDEKENIPPSLAPMNMNMNMNVNINTSPSSTNSSATILSTDHDADEELDGIQWDDRFSPTTTTTTTMTSRANAPVNDELLEQALAFEVRSAREIRRVQRLRNLVQEELVNLAQMRRSQVQVQMQMQMQMQSHDDREDMELLGNDYVLLGYDY